MPLYLNPSPAALALNNLASVADDDGDTKTKKPALYRAGQAVGAGLNAAHRVAAAGDMAADRAINSAVDAAHLGVSNFVRGVQGKSPLATLPAPTTAANDPAPTTTVATSPAGNALARPAPIFNPTIGQLRAGGAVPALPRGASSRGPGIDSGVTLPGGRKLAYGAMVDGVPTFSDGSGGPGAPPRTMTDADIQNLGSRLNIVPATVFTRGVPAFNSDNTEQNVANILASRQGGKFGITPEMEADADLAAVANQDARTTLGRAALNASRRANAAPTTLQRKTALADLTGLNTAVQSNAAATINNAAAQDRQNTGAQATLKRQAIANTGALQQQALQNEGELARTDLAGQYDVAGRLAQGQARTALTEKDLTAGAIKLLPQVLGLNAAGMIDDPNAKGGMRQATEQEIAAAMQRAKAIIQGQLATPSNENGAPYPEGTRLRGSDRKTYVVKNGQPVAAA